MNRQRILAQRLTHERQLVSYWKDRAIRAEELNEVLLKDKDAAESAAPAMEKSGRRYRLRKRSR